MPFRFRKSLKIAPGLKLNLSKSGVSTTLGGAGHSVNVGKNGVRSTVGLPGTGLSYTSQTAAPFAAAKSSPPPPAAPSQNQNTGCLPLQLLFIPFQIVISIFKSIQNPSSRKGTLIGLGVLLTLCCGFFGFSSLMGGANSQPTATPVNVSSIRTRTVQTALAQLTTPPTAKPTSTLVPVQATATIIPSALPAATNTPAQSSSLAGCVPTENQKTGTVMSIVDGDTIKVLIDGATYSVHYLGVSAPKNGAYYSFEATQYSSPLFAQKITLYQDKIDKDANGILQRYIFQGDKFINLTLLQQGYAAVDKLADYSCQSVFSAAAQTAQNSSLGLWGAPPTPVFVAAPTAAPGSTGSSSGSGFDNNGDGKVTCADFSTRAQAKAALSAGYTALDRDGDGIPCEDLP